MLLGCVKGLRWDVELRAVAEGRAGRWRLRMSLRGLAAQGYVSGERQEAWCPLNRWMMALRGLSHGCGAASGRHVS